VSSGSNSFGGLTAAVGLNYIAGPRLQLSTHVTRSVSASFLEGVGYSVVTQVDGGATYQVSSRISANFGGSWGHTAYEGRVQTTGLFAPPGYQDSTTIYAGASIQIGRRSSAALNVRHIIGGSDVSLYSFTSDYVGLTLATAL